MAPAAGAPDEDLRRVADAEGRFLAAIGDITDVARPSLLAGWSVGHVLSHVARNADSHIRRARAAGRGEMVDQYPGGYEGRAAEIEQGARRPAADIVADLRRSAAELDATWRSLPDAAWNNLTRDVGGRERPLRALPARRWQELEVHLVDADVGITNRDWPEEFVVAWLPRLRASAAARLPAGRHLPEPGALDDRDELAWLYGRLHRHDLPELAPWG